MTILDFKDFIECSEVSSIQDVNNQYDYTDTHSGGRGDSSKVSCGQNDSYNELRDKYNKHYSGAQEEDIAEAMCKCCKTTSGKTWDEFYKCMENEGFNKL
jgi:hypothetical protein